MAFASSAELAAWLRANQDKRNTPDYQTVLRGFQEAVIAESRVAATPAQPTAQPESGFMPALRAGATELGGGISALMGKVGLKDIQKAQEEYEAAQKRAKEIFKPTEAGWTEAPITKFTELLGGSLPYMAAPLAAGAAAAALPITGPAALATGLGAAGLASATQFTATNLGRQMEEGKKLEQTDLGSAALAAVPQAALDTLSMRMIPGIGRLFGKAGIQVTKETAKEIAEQGLKRTLVDYSVNTGKTAGIEGLTEAAQQVFERLQAGLNITDAEARKEYFDNFIGGAILGGTLSVPGRFYERGKAKSEARGLLEEEAQKQQAEQRKAEEEAKKDPAYALKLDADYQAAVARMKELQAAVPKRPGKGALPEEQAAYKAAVAARDAHLKEVLQPLAAEYVPRKAEIAQLRERQRVEGLTPLEYQMEQAGVTLPPEAPRVFTGEEEVAPAAPVAPEVAYAQQQMTLAQRQDPGTYEAKDYVEYLMQDPAMAKRLVENKTAIPGLSKQENAAVLGGLKLQLQEQEKQARAATRAELEQQQTDLAAQQRAVRTDAADLWKASIEETEEQATEELLRPNLELIQPTGPATVKTPENIRPIQSANTLLRRIDDLFATRDQAARDTDTAFGSGNKEAGMKKAQEREAAQTSLNELEQTEGPGRALVTLRKAQDTALMNASQLIDDLRAGRTLGGPEAGTASSTPQTLINQINAQRDAFITAAVQEAATTRRLFGKSLTQEEATKAGDQMRGVFNEWVTRTMAQPRREVLEERVVQPAQMRGTEVVRGAETALVDPRPLEERRFGAYREATQVLQEQLRQLASRLAAVPKEGRRVEPTLKMQFPETEAAKVAEARGETAKTLEGALRRRRDYVSNLIDQAFQTRRVPGIADVLLTRSRDFLDRGTTGLLDAAENIADRLIRGQNIERSDLVQLRNELRAASARPGEAEVAGEREGQAELFPKEQRRAELGVIRETRRNFENAPPVRQGRAMLKRGQELLDNIKAAWAEADKRKARIQEGKVAKAERAVEQQREEYRAAFTDALNKARLERVVAEFQPKIDAAINQLAAFGKERAKALAAKDKDAARDIQTIMDMEREELQALRQQLAAAVRAPGAVLEPAEMKGTKQTRGFTQPEEVKAAANEWVQFERDALAKAEAKLAKLKGPEKAPAVREIAQQRKAVAQAESVATRAMTGLGLPGMRRVAGEVTPIKAEKEAAEERTAAEAERRAEEAEAVKARVEEKTAREAELEQRILDLGERRVEREEALKRVRTDASRERVEKELAEINKQATLAEAQLEALGEKKPRRKGPATKISGAGLAKQRPLRTGDKTAKREVDAYRRMLKSAAAGVRAEREGVVELPGVFEFGPQEKLFSRGSTATPSTIDSVRAELKQAFPDLGRVQIYDSVDALVAANPQYKGKIPSDARGFVDTAGNKAFLIAENINQGQALSVLLHEVGAHIGLKNALGEAQYNTLVNAVKSWETRNDGSKESQVAQAARARVEAAQTPASQVNDELLAYTIEEAVNAGVKPAETKGVLGQWLSRVAALFRKALEKFGLPPKSLDAQGIVDMAFGAAKMEMRPAVPQMSRRQFLRGAGAALGTMKLPPLSKEMNLKVLRSVFEESLSARDAWFGALKTAVKGKGLGRVIDQYEDVYEGDNGLVNFAQSDALQSFLYNTTYNENYQGDGYDYYLNELLSGKDGVKVVADLQQALRAQAASFVDAVQKMAKEKGLPEVGELFFSAPEQGRVVDITKQLKERKAALEEKRDQLEDEEDFKEYEDIKAELRQLAKDAYERDILALWPKIQAAKKVLDTTKYPGSLAAAALKRSIDEFQTDYIDRYNKLQDVTDERFDYRTLDRLLRENLPQELEAFDAYMAQLSGKPKATAPVGEIKFSRNLPTASRVANALVAEEPGIMDKIRQNLIGFRTQFIDKLEPVEQALKRGMVDALKATQALFYLRMYDQRMHFTSLAISDGAPTVIEKTRRDGRTERLIETKPGANIKQVVDILKRDAVAKAAGSADEANKMFTLYLAAIRGERVGYDTLNFGRTWAETEIKRLETELRSTQLSSETRSNLQKKKVSLEKRLDSMPTEADFKAAKAEIEGNDALREAFSEARDIYNQYNRNLIEFAVQTGAIGRDLANRLLASNDYVPYYRMRDGVAQLIIGKETPIRIGNLKDSPHLQELIGGDEAIFDFLTSSVQNTSMLLDMSLRNLATKNLMFELRDVGLAKISKVKGGNAPTGSVTFKKDGEEYFAVVDTDTIGVDSELLVKGLAGIPTMFPAFVRLFGIPARFLRRAVVASPVYMARQLFRDSGTAAIASGADLIPVLSSLQQIGKEKALERRGITGGAVFTGMPEDQTRMLKEMQAGTVSLTNGLAWMETQSARVDALTREAQYESYREQGLSEMEATLMSLESMNFSRRGLSPTMHMVSTLIPFFNAQIQGLDVLYRSFRGQMPMNKRLEIREKLWTRGMMLFGLSMIYAASMGEEDEYYKNAKPEEKYGNWFVPIPGMKEPLRLPIPFELGYIFKALPEAIVNTLRSKEGGEEALKALVHIVQQTVPGLSSYFMPQAIKPALEVAFGKSMYTGRDIESAREQMVEPGQRYRDSTTELAKQVGEMTGFSPIKIEYLIRGYTGGMGMAALAMLSAPFGSSGPEAATKRVTDLPVVGTLFQPVDASGIIDMAYEKMNKVRQIKETYEDMLDKGRTADATAYLNRNINEMALASVAGSFRQEMGEITKYERDVRNSTMTPDQKRKALDEVRQAKIKISEAVRALYGKREPLAALA